jgi:hypothetical protein
VSADPPECDVARRAIQSRRFVGWRGLPIGCSPSALFGVPLDGTWGERQLGAAFAPAAVRLLDIAGYYRPMAFVRDGVVVQFSGMNPRLADPWDRLRGDLGEPDVALDWMHATQSVPGGELVFAGRGITVFVGDEGDRVVHVAVYRPTTSEDYVRTLRQRHGKQPLPRI